jgi:glucosamine-phosphate N-acetyltransferase
MVKFEYISLLKLVQDDNNISTEEILEKYIVLLSQLTNVSDISKEKFIENLLQIENIGHICVCYFINSENTIEFIGSGTIIFEPKIIRNGKCVGHIEDIVVDKNYRSVGVAREIINELLSLAGDKNCYKVILDCKNNLSEFYEKLGFEKHGIQMSKYFI